MEITRNPLPLSALIESEFPGSLKRGVVIRPENGDESGFDSGRCHLLRHYGKVKDPTLENLLQGKLFDTPGLLHPHQITTRLTREEQKLVHISKELRPRTYRIKAGHTVHIAVLMRLDLEESSVDSIYLTVGACGHLLISHYTWEKQENAQICQRNILAFSLSHRLGRSKLKSLGNGSHTFVAAGFTVSKIVSKADQALNKRRQNEKKRKQSDPKVSVPAESPILTVGADSNSC
ncbi:hypothetical protein CMV_024527 [Castanea mollissima]|uniref:Uncharacterized protein n=1 Tax=Castanea mollissima TaxID=60419 RepID=A0A8J4QE50_9ROSI|nr:hypothetical protein CMV_024527 [Castanea mollissima]